MHCGTGNSEKKKERRKKERRKTPLPSSIMPEQYQLT